MNEEKWIKKSLMIFNSIKYAPEYRALLVSKKEPSLAYRLQISLARICFLLEQLGRLDDFTGEQIMGMVNSRGFHRLAKVDNLIVELESELDATKSVTMDEWKRKITEAFHTGKSDLELSRRIRER